MSERQAQCVGPGDRLDIRYRVLHQGRELEACVGKDSVEYHMGADQWPAVLEQALLGARVGEQVSLSVSAADELFGKPDPERVIDMDEQDFSQPPEPGDLVAFELPDGEQIEGQVLSIFGDKIQVDFNHPYAGRDLEFQVTVVAIN